jgi:mRNA-degrading endonuclease toxin of MazEF toxin-antitoxin module
MTTKPQLSAGAHLEKAIRDDLPAHVELDPREEELLRQAVAQADDIAALDADIRVRGRVLDTGYVNPSVREARQARVALSRLLSGIDLPAAANTTVLRSEKANKAR